MEGDLPELAQVPPGSNKNLADIKPKRTISKYARPH